MKIRVEFEQTPDSQRIEESSDFLAFWRDPDGNISWTHTGWAQPDVEEALSKARESARPVVIQ